jgi:hypothetical protein
MCPSLGKDQKKAAQAATRFSLGKRCSLVTRKMAQLHAQDILLAGQIKLFFQ